MKQALLFVTALLCFLSQTSSTIINVPAQYSTIQAAINSSVNGDTVLVQPGTYIENISFRGKRIILTSIYYMTNNPASIYATVIDGSNPVSADTGSCVIIADGEDSTTVLQGFAITRGSGTKWNDEHFAGVYREGGGILVQFASPVIQNNIIFNNEVTNVTGVNSTGGGGVRIGDSYVRFYNNIVMNNTARYGAGIVLNYTGGDYKNNIICANYGSYQFGSGSGIWINNTFSRPLTIINNTIANNSATSNFSGVYGSNFAQLRNNIIWGNTGGAGQVSPSMNIRYSDVQGGYTGAGNINQDPMFADSNYVLQVSSPCIDKGDSSTVYDDLPDPNNPSNAKYPSRGALRNDMGAYGGPLARLLTNQLIGVPGLGTEIPESFALYQNYPNPFNPETIITFDLNNGGLTSLKVFDVKGSLIAELRNGMMSAGRHSVNFSAGNLSSGIYFYRLENAGNVLTQKMILVK